MQYVLPPVATWCVGQAASMASLLLTAGSPGMRHSLPNSRIMVHQPSGHATVSSLNCVISGFVAHSETNKPLLFDGQCLPLHLYDLLLHLYVAV